MFEILKTPEVQQTLAQIFSQIIAFLIFFWILKKFTWKPLIALLDERRQRIEAEFDYLEKQKQQLQELRNEYENRLRTIESEARAKIQEAIREGRRIAREITDSAREEGHQILTRAHQSIELEIAKARIDLRDEVVDLVIHTTEKLLQKCLDEQKQRELINCFMKNLRKNQNEN
ncbi:MAG: F0F1 ATP synthase subunit B [Candidatus Sumerlaeia bacterium]|nr:F0F1 ATP synthase subunit B [Candidatus Sumerlaeia bacterium]